MVDDQNVDRTAGRFELEAELFVERGQTLVAVYRKLPSHAVHVHRRGYSSALAEWKPTNAWART